MIHDFTLVNGYSFSLTTAVERAEIFSGPPAIAFLKSGSGARIQ
jgi:hypothetical protein